MDWKNKNILIVGATCPLGKSFARHLASRGSSLLLLGRNEEKLSSLESALKEVYGSCISHGVFDAEDLPRAKRLLKKVISTEGPIDGVIFSLGSANLLKKTSAPLKNIFEKITTINYTAVTEFTEIMIDHFHTRKKGFVIAVGSVGGERNYFAKYLPCAFEAGLYDEPHYRRVLAYTKAKYDLHLWLDHLRGESGRMNIPILTVKPATIDTESAKSVHTMFPKIVPEIIVKKSLKAIEDKKTELYMPPYWKYILKVLPFLPSWFIKGVLQRRSGGKI